jgi:putative intracellular protease/amidase
MKQRTVHFFVFDTLADWEAGYAVAGLNNAAFPAHGGRFRVRTVGLSSAPVVTMGGVTILPELTLDDLLPEHSAMLILPGGDSWDQGQNGEALEKARLFLEAGVPVAAICGATAGLARAGMLDDKRHTSNAREYLQATNYQGAALYQDEPAVTDGDLISANSTAPLEFAYQIFKRLDLFPPEMLEAWYGLFKTGDPAHYAALMGA